MGCFLFFNSEKDLEKRHPFPFSKCRKTLSETTRAGKKINNRDYIFFCCHY